VRIDDHRKKWRKQAACYDDSCLPVRQNLLNLKPSEIRRSLSKESGKIGCEHRSNVDDIQSTFLARGSVHRQESARAAVDVDSVTLQKQVFSLAEPCVLDSVTYSPALPLSCSLALAASIDGVVKLARTTAHDMCVR
jgi:hypothetical protein